MGLVQGFSQWAIKCHKDTNHLYDGYLPYEFHLRMVVANARKFMHLACEKHKPEEHVIYCGCWGHDLAEDTRENYSSIYSNARTIAHNNYAILYHLDPADSATMIANIIYACTNEKGKNRKERESDKYFEGIRTTPYATFVKLCDRLANIQYSKMTESESDNKLNMYRKEHTRFKEQLYDEKYKPMFDLMEELLN